METAYMVRDWALGTITDYMANGNIILMFLSFYRLTWVPRCWPRATPDFGSVSVISSFLLQDIPRHPETRLLEVREAFKRGPLLVVFRPIFHSLQVTIKTNLLAELKHQAPN